MIYLEGLNSIIECVYLGESLNNRSNTCDVYVNPEAIKYLTGKTIIVNDLAYPQDKIDTLVKNGCKVISRIYSDRPGVEVRPYILKLCFSVMWNGRTLEKYNSLNSIFTEGYCDFDIEEYKLYFPKLKTYSGEMDQYGNLTALGWVLQQVGVNIRTDTPFIDQDIVKTEKYIRIG